MNEEEFSVLTPSDFYAPRFLLENRENHKGLGYHAHIRFLKNGDYKRSGYVLTLKDDIFYVTKHGNKGTVLFNLEKNKSSLLKEIKHSLKRCFDGIASEQILIPNKDAIPLYRIS